MGTRAIIALAESGRSPVFFYRHADGSPEGVAGVLDRFCAWRRENRIRANPMQAGGWLVLLGHQEMQQHFRTSGELENARRLAQGEPGEDGDSLFGWKASTIEPMAADQGIWDAEYLHVVHLGRAVWSPVGIAGNPALHAAGEQVYQAARPAVRMLQGNALQAAREDYRAALREAARETAEGLESGALAARGDAPDKSGASAPEPGA